MPKLKKFKCDILSIFQTMCTLSISELVVKRMKTSPFAWTNPLSGYMMVVIPQGKKETAKNFQLRLVKDPTSFTGANKNFRPEYIMKWLNRHVGTRL